MQRKKIGLIGDVTWHSTRIYFERLNQLAAETGEFVSCDLVVRNLNFRHFVDLQRSGRIGDLQRLLATEVERLKVQGCGLWAIASNTAHIYVSDEDNEQVTIYDALAASIQTSGFKRIGLFGTKYVMREGKYADAIRARGVDLVLPPKNIANDVNESIYKDLALGRFTLTWKDRYHKLIEEYVAKLEIDAIILGCTEIPVLMANETAAVPLIDSTECHIQNIWRRSQS